MGPRSAGYSARCSWSPVICTWPRNSSKRTLPVRQRQAIVLHYLVDLPVQEIAQTLGVPAGTVKTLLARGRRALAARLGEAEEVLDRT